MLVIRMAPRDLVRVAEIDRSEHVTFAYEDAGGTLRRRAVEWDVPDFYPTGSGHHTHQSVMDTWQPVVDEGGVLLGVEGDDGLAGMAIVVPSFEPGLGWMAFLYVDRACRRRGVAAALWAECERLARKAGNTSMWVSAVPSGPAIDFYVSRGCVLPPEPHQGLSDKEPEDIQLVKAL